MLSADCAEEGSRVCIALKSTAHSLTNRRSMVASLKKGSQGTSMQGVESSPGRRKRMKKRRAVQEERWAKRSGEVRARSLDELTENERRQLGL